MDVLILKPIRQYCKGQVVRNLGGAYGRRLCQLGFAEPYTEAPSEERATAPAPETATPPRRKGRT